MWGAREARVGTNVAPSLWLLVTALSRCLPGRSDLVVNRLPWGLVAGSLVAALSPVSSRRSGLVVPGFLVARPTYFCALVAFGRRATPSPQGVVRY